MERIARPLRAAGWPSRAGCAQGARPNHTILRSSSNLVPTPKLEYGSVVGKVFGVVPEHNFLDDPLAAVDVNDAAFATAGDGGAEVYFLGAAIAKVNDAALDVDARTAYHQFDGIEAAFASGDEDLVAVEAVVDEALAQFFPARGCSGSGGGRRSEGHGKASGQPKCSKQKDSHGFVVLVGDWTSQRQQGLNACRKN